MRACHTIVANASWQERLRPEARVKEDLMSDDGSRYRYRSEAA